ncbi:nuclear transport factor 2 family protein [Rhodohalobacter sp. 614A]|uniref:nuclear transport factor 2 family protein n=1 Tax=Rhodohalobacter sp. 614A TaxID=2908649 RepID=UPI001F47B81D|nr:nuclear transport factor 2 family protein [Rhodohalobacter sp. 614A]
MNGKIFILTTLMLLTGVYISYGQQSSPEEAVIETLEAFHLAIIANDSEAAKKLLSDSVQILEGGNIETKHEYLSHHFHSDGRFLSAIDRKIDSQTISMEGNVAWISTQSHFWGNFNDRDIDLNGLELVVLQKVDENWKITALHWSSSPGG